MMAWGDRVPLPALRVLGAVEVLGATGLILPPLTGIAPPLAPAAAIGFVLLHIGAITVHLSGGDRRIALNAGLNEPPRRRSDALRPAFGQGGAEWAPPLFLTDP